MFEPLMAERMVTGWLGAAVRDDSCSAPTLIWPAPGAREGSPEEGITTSRVSVLKERLR